MAHLIDKDALVAEIEKLVDKGKYHEEFDCAYRDGNNGALYALKDKLDTIEVKEVDLEKEIRDFIKLYHLHIKDGGQIVFENNDSPNFMCDMRSIAKHFFELGIRNTITEEDCKLIWNIGDEIPNMPEEEFFKELLKRYKAQKGE